LNEEGPEGTHKKKSRVSEDQEVGNKKSLEKKIIKKERIMKGESDAHPNN